MHKTSDYLFTGQRDGFRDSPAKTSDFCRPELWTVRCSMLLLICSSSFWGLGLSCTESSSPSGLNVLNWKRTENPPTAGAAEGSDRKLLLELRKVQDTSWGGEHEKVTLPWRTKKQRTQIYMQLQQQVRGWRRGKATVACLQINVTLICRGKGSGWLEEPELRLVLKANRGINC